MLLHASSARCFPTLTYAATAWTTRHPFVSPFHVMVRWSPTCRSVSWCAALELNPHVPLLYSPEEHFSPLSPVSSQSFSFNSLSLSLTLCLSPLSSLISLCSAILTHLLVLCFCSFVLGAVRKVQVAGQGADHLQAAELQADDGRRAGDHGPGEQLASSRHPSALADVNYSMTCTATGSRCCDPCVLQVPFKHCHLYQILAHGYCTHVHHRRLRRV